MNAPSPLTSPSPSPGPPPIQPDHFYNAPLSPPSSPSSSDSSKHFLDPDDDPLAQRGIPVFKPTMEEFKDFEAYMSQVECWGMKSGIIKVIPPIEWKGSLPPLPPLLAPVKIKSPIEQHMLGRGGLFRQENVEKRRIMSVREWAELCAKPDLRAPGINDVGLRKVEVAESKKKRGRKTADGDTQEEDGKEDKEVEAEDGASERAHNECSTPTDQSTPSAVPTPTKARAKPQTREAREASLAERASKDTEFSNIFDPHTDWLPKDTKADDYTPEFCTKLERQYWRNCGLGKAAWYGADTQGSLYTDTTTSWNVSKLPSTLSRLLPSSSTTKLPGVNTPYLYFGMWRATFAWHVEDMDLFSINYIHFGAPKFWYAVPQGRATALEGVMKSYFPKDTSQCPQFLRHKSFLASPTLLAQSSCRPNTLVQHAGEFVVTFPRGYHAGFNLGFNCAESVNFALESWLELGKKARVCNCVGDSVRIDVDQLLQDREAEKLNPSSSTAADENGKAKLPKKRKAPNDNSPKAKKVKTHSHSSSTSKVTLKLGPIPVDSGSFPCCLCVSRNTIGLLRVVDPPIGEKADGGGGEGGMWMAHRECADIVPETWVDEVDVRDATGNNEKRTEKVVYGVDGIVKDRWNLKCSHCTKARNKLHGAPIQCTKGKCPKAFHVSCAKEGGESGIIFNVLKEVEKEVVLLDPQPPAPSPPAVQNLADGTLSMGDTHMDALPFVSAPPHAEIWPRVLKIIRKVDVQVLCAQHNPAVAAAKKASKQDKIKSDLLALPPMARIKIRVSAGVFEVTLLRVMAEISSVEVLWDRGLKREFKWGSVVFGSTEGQNVVQKPSEFATDNTQQGAVSATTVTPQPAPSHLPVPMQYPSHAPPRNGYAAGAWSYQPPFEMRLKQPDPPIPSNQLYNNPYYRNPGPPPLFDKDGRPQPLPPPSYSEHHYPPTPNQYRAQLQWQQPYQGPRPGANYYRSDSALAQNDDAAPRYSECGGENVSGGADQPNREDSDGDIQMTFKGLAALNSLQPSQIQDILRANPELRAAMQVAAASDGQQRADSSS